MRPLQLNVFLVKSHLWIDGLIPTAKQHFLLQLRNWKEMERWSSQYKCWATYAIYICIWMCTLYMHAYSVLYTYIYILHVLHICEYIYVFYKCWIRFFWSHFDSYVEIECLCEQEKPSYLFWSLVSDGFLNKILANHSVKGKMWRKLHV